MEKELMNESELPPQKSRLEKVKVLFNKGYVIAKTTHKNGGLLSFFTSKKGRKLLKKLFINGVNLFLNKEDTTKIVAYALWRKANMPTEADFSKLQKQLNHFNLQPKISLLVPVYNTNKDFLLEMISSVERQLYENWELCLADDNSNKQETIEALKVAQLRDSRIKVVVRTQNGHISACTNSALSIATGDFCALLDHDDILPKDALAEIVALINRHPDADFIYTDEDKTDGKGFYTEPNFKPSWSPDNLLSRNYIGHFTVLKTSILKEIGGFSLGMEGSQDYDLYLRFLEKTTSVYHLPKVLYHWRMHDESVAMNLYAKPYAYIAAEKALEEAITRQGENGTVTMSEDILGHYTIRYHLSKRDKVSILIPSKNNALLLEQCLSSIFLKTTYENFEVIIIDNGSSEYSHQEVLDNYKYKYPTRFYYYKHEIPFNFSKLINFGVLKANGAYIVLLNNDTKIISTDWLEAMLEQAQRTSVGVVGVKLLYPNGRIQHAGIVFDHDFLPKHIFSGEKNLSTNRLHTSINNFPALTAACVMVAKAKFIEVGGFDEAFAVEFNDVDFCLKMVQNGYRNVYIPHAQLYHYESITRGNAERSPAKYSVFLKERELFLTRWASYIKRFNEDNYHCYESEVKR